MERQRDLSCLAALTALGCVCVSGGIFLCKLFPCHYRSTLCAVCIFFLSMWPWLLLCCGLRQSTFHRERQIKSVNEVFFSVSAWNSMCPVSDSILLLFHEVILPFKPQQKLAAKDTLWVESWQGYLTNEDRNVLFVAHWAEEEPCLFVLRCWDRA